MEGTKISFQFPESNLSKANVNFNTIKNYVIPKPQLCNKLLTFKYGNYRIVGYPVNVKAPYYARNSFNFNFVYVFPYDCATTPYEPSIERLGKMFSVLEEQSQILSKAEMDPVYFQVKSNKIKGLDDINTQDKSSPDVCSNTTNEKYNDIINEILGGSPQLCIPDFLTKLYQDLNNYSECLIPIDPGNSIDIKLFPLLAPPTASVSVEDVPITTVNLTKLIDANWDPTMLKIVPYINGVNSIAKIAKISDSDVNLVIECVNHLIYYNCVLILDIFQFSNIYAPTSDISKFLTNPLLANECQKYIITRNTEFLSLDFNKKSSFSQQKPTMRTLHSSSTINSNTKKRLPSISSSSSNFDNKLSTSSLSSTFSKNRNSLDFSVTRDDSNNTILLPTKSCIFDLYRSLSQGKLLKDWYRENIQTLKSNNIDIRRFIVFGITRGLIYRCYSYPLLKNSVELFNVININSEDFKKFMKNKKNKEKKLFSTADIKPDMETFSTLKKQNSGSINSKLTAELRPENIADEILKEVYQKLNSKKQNLENERRITNPLSILHSTRSNSDPSSSAISRERSQKVSRRNKVLFDTISNDSDAGEGSINTETKERDSKDIEILIKCLRNADSMDRICTVLQKDREEVENLLHDISTYSLVNS
ncbi:related to Nitrogen permease regulator 2 [Saccharomycodes ludwigii]|uniref:Related to Nitrogen permease regulator 2 n=2 Tax=Saccharomycodes ludwigii TaxID=36035 RepID=A0A376B749_9ASCO|nr:related to Nitrogen permease regulator 2 [Saccharomycodes ludwigii]